MNYKPIKVETPAAYGKQPITVYIPQAYNEPGKWHKGIASFWDLDFDLADGLVSIKRSDVDYKRAGFVWQDSEGQIKVASWPVDMLHATSKHYVDYQLEQQSALKLNRLGYDSNTRVYAANPNGTDTSFIVQVDPIGNSIPVRDPSGRISCTDPLFNTDAVNLQTIKRLFSDFLTRESLVDIIGIADFGKPGLMSPEMVDVFLYVVTTIQQWDSDNDNKVVDTLREVFALLNTFSEEADLGAILNSKVDAKFVKDYVETYLSDLPNSPGSGIDTSNFLVKLSNQGGPGAYNVVYLNGDDQRLVKATPYMEGPETIVMRGENNNITVPETPLYGSDAASKYYVDSKSLPSVTNSDNGKFLRVVAGVWTTSSISTASEVYF